MSPIAKAISTAWFQSEDPEAVFEPGDFAEILFDRTIYRPREESEFKSFLADCIREGLEGRHLQALRYQFDDSEVEEAYRMRL